MKNRRGPAPARRAAERGTVARKFQTSRRREFLSFKHHREVAALPPATADRPYSLRRRVALRPRPRSKKSFGATSPSVTRAMAIR